MQAFLALEDDERPLPAPVHQVSHRKLRLGRAAGQHSSPFRSGVVELSSPQQHGSAVQLLERTQLCRPKPDLGTRQAA